MGARARKPVCWYNPSRVRGVNLTTNSKSRFSGTHTGPTKSRPNSKANEFSTIRSMRMQFAGPNNLMMLVLSVAVLCSTNVRASTNGTKSYNPGYSPERQLGWVTGSYKKRPMRNWEKSNPNAFERYLNSPAYRINKQFPRRPRKHPFKPRTWLCDNAGAYCKENTKATWELKCFRLRKLVRTFINTSTMKKKTMKVPRLFYWCDTCKREYQKKVYEHSKKEDEVFDGLPIMPIEGVRLHPSAPFFWDHLPRGFILYNRDIHRRIFSKLTYFVDKSRMDVDKRRRLVPQDFKKSSLDMT